jgi:hypothetical protein
VAYCRRMASGQGSIKDWLGIWRNDPGHVALGMSSAPAKGDRRAVQVRVQTGTEAEEFWGVIIGIDEVSFDLATESGPATYYNSPSSVKRIRFANVRQARLADWLVQGSAG